MGDSRNSADYGKKMKPADLYAEEGAKRGANVMVRSAGLGELRGDLGHAGHNHGHAQSAKNDREGAGSSEQARQFSRQTKYAAADDGIDDQGGHRPAADRSDKWHGGLAAAARKFIARRSLEESRSPPG